MNISKWGATRSGAGIRIRGRDEKGEPITMKVSWINGPDERNTYPTVQDERGIYHNLV